MKHCICFILSAVFLLNLNGQEKEKFLSVFQIQPCKKTACPPLEFHGISMYLYSHLKQYNTRIRREKCQGPVRKS